MPVVQQYYGIHAAPPKVSFLGSFASAYIGTKTKRMEEEYARRWAQADPMEKEKILVNLQTQLVNAQKQRMAMEEAIQTGRYDLAKEYMRVMGVYETADATRDAAGLSAEASEKRTAAEYSLGQQQLGALSSDVERAAREDVVFGTSGLRAWLAANPGASEADIEREFQREIGEMSQKGAARAEAEKSPGARERLKDVYEQELRAQLGPIFSMQDVTAFRGKDPGLLMDRAVEDFMPGYTPKTAATPTFSEVTGNVSTGRRGGTLPPPGEIFPEEMFTTPTGTTGYKTSVSGNAPPARQTTTTVGRQGPSGGVTTKTTTTEPAQAPAPVPVEGGEPRPVSATPGGPTIDMSRFTPEEREYIQQYMAAPGSGLSPAEESIQRQIERLQNQPEARFDASQPWDKYYQQLFRKQDPGKAARTQRIIEAYKRDPEALRAALAASEYVGPVRSAIRGVTRRDKPVIFQQSAPTIEPDEDVTIPSGRMDLGDEQDVVVQPGALMDLGEDVTVQSGKMNLDGLSPDDITAYLGTVKSLRSHPTVQVPPSKPKEPEVVIKTKPSEIVAEPTEEDIVIQPAASGIKEEPITEKPKKPGMWLGAPTGTVTYRPDVPEKLKRPGAKATLAEHQAWTDQEAAEALKPRKRDDLSIYSAPTAAEEQARAGAVAATSPTPKKRKKKGKDGLTDGTETEEQDTGTPTE